MTGQFARLLDALGIAPDERISVCHKFPADDRPTATLGTAHDAPARAERYIGRADLWFGVSPIRADAALSPGQRGTAAQIARIPALWCDLDAKPAPAGMGSTAGCIEVAAEISKTLRAGPAAMVASGTGGLHVYWRLARYPEAEHPRAVGLLRRFGILVQVVARAAGGGADNVFDPARIMRVPGTTNLKPGGGPVTATFPADNGAEPDELTLDDLEDALNVAGIPAAPVAEETDPVAERDWPAGTTTCGYVQAMVTGWATDVPRAGRHQWLLNQSARLAAAARLGCITPNDRRAAETTLAARFNQICATIGEPRQVPATEVPAALLFGVATVESKPLDAVHAELGNHHTNDQPADDTPPDDDRSDTQDSNGRHLRLVPAAGIKPRRVRWLWTDRFALGSLGIIAGREGLGKSTICYTLAALVTQGAMRGEFHNQPKSVIVCATEDSWEHTIVPRLIAAEADLNRVYRVDVTKDGLPIGLVLPNDLHQLEEAAKQVDAAMLLLDPLTSRLNGKLDTHKDAEVRQALEPLVALADRVNMFVLGIMHFNKSGSTDPLGLVMGSKAFTAVARSVHSVVKDPDDDTERRRLFGTPKNNLGRDDLPSLGFEIESFGVPTDDGTAWTSRLLWTGEVETSIADAVRNAAADNDDRSATQDAVEWLEAYLTQEGEADSAAVKKAARAAGHADRTLARAREKLRVVVKKNGFPPRTWWSLPDVRANGPRAHGTNGTNGTNGDDESLGDFTNGTTTRGYGTNEEGCPIGANGANGANQTGAGGANDQLWPPTGRECADCHAPVRAGRVRCDACIPNLHQQTA